MSQFPPVSQDFQMPAVPPAWPKVIGIISIVLGSLGLLCNACSLGGSALSGSLVQMMPPEAQADMQRQLQAQSSPLTMGLAAVGVLVSVLLIAAGATTLQRKPLGKVLHLAYGALGLLIAIGSIGAGIVAANQLAASEPDAAKAAATRMGGIIGAGVGGCVGGLYPLFCLVWFGVVKRNASMGGEIQDSIV